MNTHTTASTAPLCETTPAAWIGLDWGNREHDFDLQTAAGLSEEGTLAHTSESLHGWLRDLEQRFGGRPVASGVYQVVLSARVGGELVREVRSVVLVE